MAVGTRDGSITVWDLSPPPEDDKDDDDYRNHDKNSGRTILCEMKNVHLGGIAQLEYLPQEPLLISTGLVSNAIKMHIFDNPDHSGRILRYRAGHAKGPPKVVSYLHPSTGGLLANAADGTDAGMAGQLISAGSVDRAVRLFSAARSVLDKEFGQGVGLEKRAKQLGLRDKEELLLPVVKDMEFCQARTRDWGDMVTIHQHHSIAYVWSTKRGAQTGPVLRQPEWNVSARKPPPPASTHATSLSMSPCGNFCIVGTAGGTIYKYNVQSGQPRGSYPPSIQGNDSKQGRGKSVAGDISRTIRQLEKDSEISNRKANVKRRELDLIEQGQRDKAYRAKLQKASHTDAVTGLAVDAMNKTVISVGRDAKLILWSFSTHAPHRKSPHILPSPACKMTYVRDSDMAAIALEDYSIFLFDCTALNIVRRLGVKYSMARHTGPITDLAFSPDGRSLYSASLDSTIRMWDIPTNTCVDWMTFASAPTSLTVSPTGEYLASTHANSLGISLWSDRSFYETIHTDGKDIQHPYAMDEPVPASETWEASTTPPTPTEGIATSKNPPQNDEKAGTPAVAKETGLITLSGLPAAHWKNLFHLELIKERNKPKEPPKKPPSAPFFLQWRGGEAMSSTPNKETGTDADPSQKETNDDEWASAWTDENEEVKTGEDEAGLVSKRSLEDDAVDMSKRPKRPKVTRYRSELATKLMNYSQNSSAAYQDLIDYIAGLGPSAIDVELSSLCAGLHDLEEGIPLLCVTCDWFLECCQRRDRFEAVNAYLHRFLHLHGPVIAGIKDDTFQLDYGDTDASVKEFIEQSRKHLLECIIKLEKVQKEGDAHLRNKMQHSLCLLRHLTRMV
jgi:U3 small nucleolar RNA-associated protein 21